MQSPPLTLHTTKLSIVRVCKAWYRLVIELLYANASRYRAAACTGRDAGRARSSRGPGPQHRRTYGITCRQTTRGYTRRSSPSSLTLCSGLTEFCFNPVGVSKHNPCVMPSTAHQCSTLTSLHLSRADSYADMVPLLSRVCTTLRSATLPLASRSSFPALTPHPTLEFTRLTALCLIISHDSHFPSTHWLLPRVETLTLATPTSPPALFCSLMMCDVDAYLGALFAACSTTRTLTIPVDLPESTYMQALPASLERMMRTSFLEAEVLPLSDSTAGDTKTVPSLQLSLPAGSWLEGMLALDELDEDDVEDPDYEPSETSSASISGTRPIGERESRSRSVVRRR
ncbi:hypothetical protein MKEN_00841600 [Mycena kentingensis (nom. inval.)]|nr:hypothetical protein MKEN_00841600 [Mycena kentingensis (nom. inval.)]